MREEREGRVPRTCNSLSSFSLGGRRRLALFFSLLLLPILLLSFAGRVRGEGEGGRPAMVGDPNLGQEMAM